MQTWSWCVIQKFTTSFSPQTCPVSLLTLSFLCSSGKKQGTRIGFSYKWPIYERESQAVNSVVFSSKHFPCDGLVIWHMASHRRHADSSWQISKSLMEEYTMQKKIQPFSKWECSCNLKTLWSLEIITCSINLAKSVHNALRPASSNILSNVMSCKATRVVSNMSRPAWFANMNTGNGCNIKGRRITLVSCDKN